jgi:hypothetical protein
MTVQNIAFKMNYYCLSHWFRLLFFPEDEGSTFLRKVGDLPFLCSCTTGVSLLNLLGKGHEVCMGEIRKARKILFQKPHHA